MKKFIYTYLDEETGKRKTNTIMAESLEDAQRELSNLILIRIRETKLSFGSKGSPSRYYKYYENLMHRFGFMLSASLNVVDIIDLVISEYKKEKGLVKAFQSIKERITGGETLSAAFAAYPNVFDVMVTSTISIGEESGQLDKMFLRLSEFYGRKQKLNKVIKKSMVQPGLTLSVCIVAFIFIVTSILPKLLSVFMEVGAEIPKATQIMLDVSEFMQNYLLFIIIGIIFLVYFVRVLLKNPTIRYSLDKVIMSLPVIGKYLKNINLAVITSNLGILLESGVDLQYSLQLITDITKNTYLKAMIVRAREKIEQGVLMSDAFASEPELFDEVFVSVLRVGETTGGLNTVLGQLSEEYFEIVNNLAEKVTTVLNFVVLVVITIIVGVMVVAIYGPIQGLSEGLMNMN